MDFDSISCILDYLSPIEISLLVQSDTFFIRRNNLIEEILEEAKVPSELILEEGLYHSTKYLIECGEVDAEYALGAVSYRDIRLLKYLIEKLDGLDFRPYLATCISKRDSESAKLFVEKINLPFDYNEDLFDSVIRGYTQIVKLLLENKAEASLGDNHAIKLACSEGKTDITRLLIEYKADFTAENNCCIRWASRSGHIETVKLLIESKASVTDNPCLKWASLKKRDDVVKLLLENGASF